jgi:cation diffusion facilitator CzcD-associated flavoprotein CzcO
VAARALDFTGLPQRSSVIGDLMIKQVEVAIVGTGFSGLGAAITLKQAGNESFVVLEKADEVGGTWRENHYPGCACDVPSHLYSFSFEPNPRWSRMFAPQSEILDYLKHCADKYGIRPHIRFGSEVREARFDERTGLWTILTSRDQTIVARHLVLGMGALSRPAMPSLHGLEKFKGTTFHSAEWNHDYNLTGKRVAVIGTGASSIQFVPEIVNKVDHLDLYQRTAPWVMPKPDREFSMNALSVFDRSVSAQKALRYGIYWIMEARALGFTIDKRVMKLAEHLGKKFIHKQLGDTELAKKVTPNYTPGCKRILISNDYYPALAKPNVDVVTDGISEVTATGLVTNDGTHREVDAILFGTGFRVTDLLTPLRIYGIGGVDLNDAWKSGMEAYLGTTISGFPNLYMLMGPNTGLGHNSMVFMIEAQIHYVMNHMRLMRDKRARYADVRKGAQHDFNERIHSRLSKSVWASGCKSWYLDASGRNSTVWPGFTFEYWLRTRNVAAQDYVFMPSIATDVEGVSIAPTRAEMSAS